MNAHDRFTSRSENGILPMVSELRELRRQLALSQAEFADRLGVPAETLRTWDSGRRPAPAPVMRRARDAACRCVDETELVRLTQLATEFSVHPASTTLSD